MSTRAREEGASLWRRILALVLLPIFVVVLLFVAVIVAILLVIGGIIDILQFVFFGTTGAVRWVAGLVMGLGDWIRGLAT